MTGTKVLRILKAKGLASEIPEDLYHMIKKAVSIRKHLERNRKVRPSLCSEVSELIVMHDVLKAMWKGRPKQSHLCTTDGLMELE